jgi:hypothetical protein
LFEMSRLVLRDRVGDQVVECARHLRQMT